MARFAAPRRLALALALAAGASACGSKARVAAATQPMPAAFDPAQSDPKALAIVDAGIAKLGGYASWEKLKELRFTVRYLDGGTVKAQFQHAWDRWNGRHAFATPVPVADRPGEFRVQEVKYDLFEKNADALAEAARQRLDEDLYFLALVYKLRDPGVKLAIDNPQITIDGATVCQPSCTSIQVTFDPAVGDQVWYVNFNNESGLPEVIEKQMGGGRIGYALESWVDAGGLKWPTKFQNLGLPSEVLEYSDVAVGEPEDATYQPTVQ